MALKVVLHFTEAKTFSEHFLQFRQNKCLYFFCSIYKNTTLMPVIVSLISRRLQLYIIILIQRLHYESTVFPARNSNVITIEQQIKELGQKNTLINPFMVCVAVSTVGLSGPQQFGSGVAWSSQMLGKNISDLCFVVPSLTRVD